MSNMWVGTHTVDGRVIPGASMQYGGLGGGGGGGGAGMPNLNDFMSQMSQFMGPDPRMSDADQDRELRNMIYDRTHRAWGDNTQFMDSPYGRLMAAQAQESTQAGVRDYLARTGGAGSAASAATAAALRAQGGKNLAQAGLAAQAQERSQVGQLMDYMARSRSLEGQMEMSRFNMRGNMAGQALGLYGNILGMQSRERMHAGDMRMQMEGMRNDFARSVMQQSAAESQASEARGREYRDRNQQSWDDFNNSWEASTGGYNTTRYG